MIRQALAPLSTLNFSAAIHYPPGEDSGLEDSGEEETQRKHSCMPAAAAEHR
jgi:hypothetical protein